MTSLRRLPRCATTGVGSLPFDDPAEAVAHVRAAYDLPFCPQLPALDGDMVGEWLGADPGRCGFSAERQRPHPAAWGAFISSLAAGPPIHGLVKLQVTGPVTLAFGLGLGPADPELPALALELARWIRTIAGRWVAEVAELGLTSIVIVDEPGLAAASDAAVHAAWDPIRAVSPVFGMHVCGEVPWGLVAAVRPRIVSFDATRPEHRADRLRALLGELSSLGILPAVGVVPVIDGAPPGDRDVAVDAADLAALAPAIVTPACGTGLRGTAEERSIATRLRAFSRAERSAADLVGPGDRHEGRTHG